MLPLLMASYCLNLLLGAVGAQLMHGYAKRVKYKIVGFKQGLTLRKGQEVIETYGIRIKRSLPLANACLCEVDEGDASIKSLAMDPTIDFIEDDLQGEVQVVPFLTMDVKKTNQEIPWGVQKIGAPHVWKDIRGEGVRVGIIDTGVDINHPDLKDNVKEVGGVLDCKNIIDDNGHGSHVAGTIAALDNDIGVVGVAPRVDLYPVKAFDKSGRGNISNVIDALGWCIEKKVQVVNMSFGFTKNSMALERAIKEAYRQNIVLVAAAGNSGGDDSVMYPAKYPEVIAVAASNSANKAAWFSSGGPEVDVIAPGASIPSTYKDGGYKSMSGTSMASPHVTAACALILAKSSMSPAKVKEVLTASAIDIGLPKNKQGAGLVNVSRAAATIKNARKNIENCQL
ncbi:MAG: S8 family peptidase [Tepidanaerobacteraceae bacterium]|nr:S8 family peptidase [Tepidanaerobacteraceae bacterium]